MALTAHDRAQRELDKATAELEKTKARLDKANEKLAVASEQARLAKAVHAVAQETADYLSEHPALQQGQQVTIEEAIAETA